MLCLSHAHPGSLPPRQTKVSLNPSQGTRAPGALTPQVLRLPLCTVLLMSFGTDYILCRAQSFIQHCNHFSAHVATQMNEQMGERKMI